MNATRASLVVLAGAGAAACNARHVPIAAPCPTCPPCVQPAEEGDAGVSASADAGCSLAAPEEHVAPSVRFALGDLATPDGVRRTFCPGRRKRCAIRMMLPAGHSDETGDARFVVRVDVDQPGGPVPGYDDGCPEVTYALVVARAGRIRRVQNLVYSGETCMHWREEQVTVGPDLFVWRDTGHGAPAAPFDYPAWERREARIELSSLRVNGCAPERIEPEIPLVAVEP
jgi:hypothetical protein